MSGKRFSRKVRYESAIHDKAKNFWKEIYSQQLDEYQTKIQKLEELTSTTKSEMKWIYDTPKEVGLYLRANPLLANHHPCIETVYDIDGEMCIGPRADGGGFKMVRLSKWQGAINKTHLWYGPIEAPKFKRMGINHE